MRIMLFVLLGCALVAAPALAAQVGEDRPALANYTINDQPPNYHGPWLNIDQYNGKGIVVVHWKRS